MVLSKAAQLKATNSQKGTPGTTVFALASVILDKKVAVKKYGSANYNKTHIEGKVLRAFDGRFVGAKNAQWKIEARWQIPGHEAGQVYTIRRQDIFLSLPTANPQTTIANFTDSIDHRDYPTKGSTTYKSNVANEGLLQNSTASAVADSSSSREDNQTGVLGGGVNTAQQEAQQRFQQQAQQRRKTQLGDVEVEANVNNYINSEDLSSDDIIEHIQATKKCMHCQKENPDGLINCGSCMQAVHMACHNPRLLEKPNIFLCEKCVTRQNADVNHPAIRLTSNTLPNTLPGFGGEPIHHPLPISLSHSQQIHPTNGVPHSQQVRPTDASQTARRSHGGAEAEECAQLPRLRHTLAKKTKAVGRDGAPKSAQGRCREPSCNKQSTLVCSACTHPTDASQKQIYFCDPLKRGCSCCFSNHVKAMHS